MKVRSTLALSASNNWDSVFDKSNPRGLLNVKWGGGGEGVESEGKELHLREELLREGALKKGRFFSSP